MGGVGLMVVLLVSLAAEQASTMDATLTLLHEEAEQKVLTNVYKTGVISMT